MNRLIAAATLVSFAASAFGLDRVAKVVAVDGIVRAAHRGEEDRILGRDADVYLGDSLITAETAKGQILFTDGTLLLLIPGSRLSIDAYAANKGSGKNEFLARLHDGGARVSTGFISKKNPENYELATPNATIGVRGTLFEARILDEKTYIGASSGDVSVKNPGGRVLIGDGESNQYASASSGSGPKTLSSRPAALDLANFAPPEGGITFADESLAPIGNAAASSTAASSGFGWGPAVGALVVLGVIAGIAAASVSNTLNSSSTSHANSD